MKEVFDADMKKRAQATTNAADDSADEADVKSSDAGEEDAE
jgi:hypothetical protein